MIDTEKYGAYLAGRFDFFTGVPDSLLKNLCSYLASNIPGNKNITAVNEGTAVALASGYYLSSGKPALVYMQNSGIGNAMNPLLSLADPLVFSVPMLMLVGWRGEPGTKDEPQHAKQGPVTKELFKAAGIRYAVHEDATDAARKQISEAYGYMNREEAPYALIVRKDTFSPYKAKFQDGSYEISGFSREEAIAAILDALSDSALLVSTTGKISRELFELREKRKEGHNRDFLTVGSMGHASQIAAAASIGSNDRRIVCLDGDGAVLMHLGGLAAIGVLKANILHIVLNNGSHDSVGGQPTIAREINLCATALACGYISSERVTNSRDLRNAVSFAEQKKGPIFIEVMVDKGAREDLRRPNQTPQENKRNFMREFTTK
ncbi:MAG: phosphonopyruvate decarboxylase [Synergistaceae bacterium]|jgi:phosphonopyruvate decarboxylase|nr:phosphonopyruvate decarboxylase [Synergistaceae bacterium]